MLAQLINLLIYADMFYSTYTNSNGAYSIDMLIRWVNDFGIKGKKYSIEDFKLSMGQNV